MAEEINAAAIPSILPQLCVGKITRLPSGVQKKGQYLRSMET